MGVEVRVEGLTKSFGAQPVWADVTSDPARRRDLACCSARPAPASPCSSRPWSGCSSPTGARSASTATTSPTCSERELYELRKLFGVLFQDGALFGSMNLYDNVAFPLREHTKQSESQIRRRSSRRRLDDGRACSAPRRKLPGEISGGMRKRAGLARALVLDPEIILFDEPDSGLDPVRTAYLNQLIIDLNAADRRDVPDRHPRHQHRPDRARQHRHALPRAPGHVRSARGAADERASRWSRSSSTAGASRPDRHGRGEGRRRARGRVGRPGAELAALPAESRAAAASPSDGGSAPPSSASPGEWCAAHGCRGAAGPARRERTRRRSHDADPARRGRCAVRATSSRLCVDVARALASRRAVPAARVHPAGLVHQLGVDPAGGAGRRSRSARSIALQLGSLIRPARRPVVHRRGRVLAVVREAGPIVTALIIAGAGGSAICADLGARKIREELDAMEVLGIDPSSGWSCRGCSRSMLVAVLLNGLVSVVGVAGGYVFNVIMQGGTPGAYLASFQALGAAVRPGRRRAQGAGLRRGRRARRLVQGHEPPAGPKGVGDAVNQSRS